MEWYCHLTVTGNEDELAKFVGKIVPPEERGKVVPQIFRSLLPVPEGLPEKTFSLHLIDGEEVNDEGRLLAQRETRDFDNAYDWALAMWGSESGDCNTVERERGEGLVEWHFKASFCPHFKGMGLIAVANSSLRFKLSVFDRGEICGAQLELTWEGGQLVEAWAQQIKYDTDFSPIPQRRDYGIGRPADDEGKFQKALFHYEAQRDSGCASDELEWTTNDCDPSSVGSSLQVDWADVCPPVEY